ncbi:MAG: Asp-tRNA(Asn)/Glu-tRNA(Gln) amidotransferase subunit GatA [Thermomicrobiales bacterium]
MTELTRLSIAEARRMLDARAVSSVDLTEAHLARIAAVDDRLHAFLHTMGEVAREQAAAADKRIAAGDAAPLTGIPLALKDVLVTTDAPTTAGSKILAGYHSPYDATVVTKLRDDGAVFLGKTNTDEFAMGSSTENSAYGPTHNPWGDLDRVPGGSSGGSAAAVAAQEAMGALGSDTGGSIRQPAGFCGVVGMKPTYGRVSRFGLIAFASSLDQIGPFARSVEDAAIILSAIAGHDPLDSTSLAVPVPDYRAALTGDLKGVRLGVPAEYFVEGMQPEVEAAVRAAIAEMEKMGAIIVPISLPYTKYALATYYIIAPAECSANLSRFDGVKYGYSHQAGDLRDSYELTRAEGFGPEVKRRIMLGTYALSSGYYDAYYIKAQKTRTLIKRDFDEAFKTVDAIVAATSPTVAFKLGEKVQDPLAMYLNDVLTIPANMAGTPGISLTCGFKDGLPIALQVLGPALGEEICLRVAHAYEQATLWKDRRADP